LDVASAESYRVNPLRGGGAIAPSNIREIEKVQGGEVVPPDGGTVRPENVQVKPFFPKGKLNAKLNVRVLGLMVRFNGLPGGHTDLHRRHPGV
jgi:hypothetical protein